MIGEIIGVLGLIVSLIPLLLLPIKVKTGTLSYFLLYIFLVLYYLSFILYYFTFNNIILMLLYIFEMAFFLNMYRSYLSKELFLVAFPIIYYVNDLALIFSFYFATFNLAELLRNRHHKKKVSMMAIISLLLFDVGIIVQLLRIFSSQDYFSIIANSIFLAGTVLFIVPALRIVRK